MSLKRCFTGQVTINYKGRLVKLVLVKAYVSGWFCTSVTSTALTQTASLLQTLVKQRPEIAPQDWSQVENMTFLARAWWFKASIMVIKKNVKNGSVGKGCWMEECFVIVFVR